MLRKVVVVFLGVAAIVLWTPAGRAAFGQVDLSGSWRSRNNEVFIGGILGVEYTGLPLNDEGRTKSLSYNPAQLAMIERQCQGWSISYQFQGPFGYDIWKEVEPTKGKVISWTLGAWEDRPEMKIWMDGRPHPTEYDLHSRAGFTTGEWDGDTLVTHTTHVQAGVQRNGVPQSDRTTMTMRITRHDNFLSIVGAVEDPVYFSEPMVFSRVYELSIAPIVSTGPPCTTIFQGTNESVGVPRYEPEANPAVDEVTKKFGVPRDAVLGFRETLYPEYRKKLQTPK